MRRSFAMDAGDRWVVISATISAGRQQRSAAGIWRCLAPCILPRRKGGCELTLYTFVESLGFRVGQLALYIFVGLLSLEGVRVVLGFVKVGDV